MKKVAGIIGLVLVAVFLYFAISTPVPDKYISSWGSNKMTEYVGGDAYNYIIEASLRGGEIAGAIISKAIYYACAAILGVFSLFCLASDPTYPQPVDNRPDLARLSEQTEKCLAEIKSISKQLEESRPDNEEEQAE